MAGGGQTSHRAQNSNGRVSLEICKLVAHNKDNIQGIVSRAMFALEEMVGKSMP